MTNFLRRYLLSLAIAAALHAQGVTPDLLLKPPADTWPAYHGDYSGRRHSALTQITPQNVGILGLAWAFQTRQTRTLKSSPLVVDGIIYFTVPDNVWAVDARSGHQVWHYTYPQNNGFHIGSRGVAMYKDWLYFMTPDAHLVCLNANDGTVRWNVAVADSIKGYWTTHVAPDRRQSRASSASPATSITSRLPQVRRSRDRQDAVASGTALRPPARPTPPPAA